MEIKIIREDFTHYHDSSEINFAAYALREEINGLFEGVRTSYYNNGQKSGQHQSKNGIRKGIEQYWNYNGSRKKIYQAKSNERQYIRIPEQINGFMIIFQYEN